MYDELRLVYRSLQDTLQGTEFPPITAPLLHDCALIQGLVLALRCQFVVDTSFDAGHMAAAVGIAFNRLPRPARQYRYLACAQDRSLSRFMFYAFKRLHPAVARYTALPLHDAERVLPSLEPNVADFGIHQAAGAEAKEDPALEQLARVIRPGGLLFVRRIVDSSPSQNFAMLRLEDRSSGGFALLHKQE